MQKSPLPSAVTSRIPHLTPHNQTRYTCGMQRDSVNAPGAVSKTEQLRRQVEAAGDVGQILAALLTLARHYADAADGVNGLSTAREARTLALQRKDFRAAANSLNSASISHYHRSDYVSAVAAAMDARDFAQRANALPEIAESFVSMSLAMLALGVLDACARIIDKGLAMTKKSPEFLDARIRLIGVKAMLRFQEDDFAETEKLCLEAITLSADCTLTQLALSHGNWGIALLRHAEKIAASGKSVYELTRRSRKHLAFALDLSEQEVDEMRIADRMASLGMVALLDGKLDDAQHLLSEARRRSVSLDYVRTAVSSTLYLGKLHLQRGEGEAAVQHLRQAVEQAARGVAADILPAAQMQLADALDFCGEADEAEVLRAGAQKLRDDNAVSRGRAAEDARQLSARILAE